MTSLSGWLTLLLQAAAVFIGYNVWKEIEKIRKAVERPARPPVIFDSQSYVAPTPVFAIWVYTNRKWELDVKSVPPGYSAGSPPTFAGSFEGQRVKTDCRRC